MSGWSNPDVTPVGTPGAPTPPPPSPGLTVPPPALPPDPFGATTPPRRRGWIRIALGLLISVACLVVTVVAFAQAIGQGQGLGDDAVAEGAVGEGLVLPATFTAPTAGDYTVYAHFSGFRESEENLRDRTIADIDCEAALPDGRTATFRGARQGQSVTLEDNATVGWFSTPPGDVTVTCRYRSVVRSRADQVELLVVAGKPSLADLLVTFAAVAGLLIGIVVTIWGARAHRRW